MRDQHHTDPAYDMFIRLFDTYKVPVHAYIQTITGDHYVAEELTQELFIKLWKKRDGYQQIENIDSYIFRMAHNACMSWFQKLALDARMANEVKRRLQFESNNVEDHIRNQEARQLLENALSTLSPQRRKIFELSRKDGLRLQEIADLLGLSFHTVNHHLVAALAHIREYFRANSNDKALILLVFTLMQ